MKIIKHYSTLKSVGKLYHLDFCQKYKYYIGNAYYNSIGDCIANKIEYKGNQYKLQYFDGCFNPYLVQL